MYDITSFYDNPQNNVYNSQKYICCYRDPNDLERNVGRPFPATPYVIDVYEEYMRAPAISDAEKLEKLKNPKTGARPQPVTAFSSNHYAEHLKEIGTAMRLFKNQKILVYDLGMDQKQRDYIQNNSTFEYRMLNFNRYPPHVKRLTTYAWKTLIWREVLIEFGALTWFDTSMSFSVNGDSYDMIVKDYIINRRSSVLMYNHETGHSNAWATNAGMWSYFPSNMTKHHVNHVMSQANGMILFNTKEFKMNIMRWALLCVLTEDCIAPMMVTGRQSNKYCPKEKDTQDFGYICHRFDQSLFSLLVHNYYYYDKTIYQIQEKRHKFLGSTARDKLKEKKYDERGIAIN